MREIKFRGVSDDGTLVYPDERRGIFGKLTSADILQRFSVVEQYTGLKDKEGKDIYEGDILKHHGIVAWNDVEHCWSRIDLNWNDNREWHHLDSLTSPLEIIGNIHDNPDLIK